MLDFLRLRHHRLHDFPSSGTDWRAHGLAKAGHERHVWRAVAIVFGAAVLLVTALFFTLLLAPLPLNTVSPRLERQLAAAIGPGWQVDIGDTAIEIAPTGGLAVELRDVEVLAPQGWRAVRVPLATAFIDAGALMTGHLAIREVVLEQPSATVVLDEADDPEGGMAGFFGEIAEATPQGFATALDQALAGLAHDVISAGFRRVAIANGTLRLRKGERGTLRAISGIDAEALAGPQKGRFSGGISAFGASGRWVVQFDRHMTEDGGSTVELRFSDLTPSDLLPIVRRVRSPLRADMPVYGVANLTLGPDSAILSGALSADVGAGLFRIGREAPVLLDEAYLRVHYDTPTKAVLLDELRYYIGGTHASWTGRLDVGKDGGPMPFMMVASEMTAGPADVAAPPLAMDAARVTGQWNPNTRILSLAGIEIVGSGVGLAAAADIGLFENGTSFAAALRLKPTDIDVVKRLWPRFLGSGARRWVIENIHSAAVEDLSLDISVTAQMIKDAGRGVALPPEAVKGVFRLSEATFSTYGEMPPISGANAVGHLSSRDFHVDVKDGRIDLPSGRKLAVGDSTFDIPDLLEPVGEGRIEVALEGTASAVAELADSEPLAVMRAEGIDIPGLTGTAQAHVSVQVPLLDDVEAEDVDYKVVVDLDRFASKAPIDGRMVSGGTLEVTVDGRTVAIRGKATVDGVVAGLDMTRPLDASEGGGARLDVTAVLGDEDRAKLGIDLGGLVKGPVGVAVQELGADKGGARHIVADLGKAEIVIPQLSWKKPAGRPAKAAFDLVPQDGGFKVVGLEVSGSGLDIAGSAEVRDGVGLVTADLARFSVRNGEDAHLTIEAPQKGRRKITMVGDVMAAEHLLGGSSGADAGSKDDVDMDIRFKRMVGGAGAEIRNLVLKSSTRGGKMTALEMSGQLGDSHFVGRIDPKNKERILIETADGGAFLRFAGLYDRARNGNLQLYLPFPLDTADMAGNLYMTDFQVVDEPALSRLATTDAQAPHGDRAVDSGPIRKAKPGEGVPIDKLLIDFRRIGKVLHIDRAMLKSDSIGGTLSGRIDHGANKVALAGTYVPAYRLNNFFSQLPLLGRALGNRKNEGLIAVTFAITGAPGAPELKINPVSVIAPGALRKIFEFR